MINDLVDSCPLHVCKESDYGVIFVLNSIYLIEFNCVWSFRVIQPGLKSQNSVVLFRLIEFDYTQNSIAYTGSNSRACRLQELQYKKYHII